MLIMLSIFVFSTEIRVNIILNYLIASVISASSKMMHPRPVVLVIIHIIIIIITRTLSSPIIRWVKIMTTRKDKKQPNDHNKFINEIQAKWLSIYNLAWLHIHVKIGRSSLVLSRIIKLWLAYLNPAEAWLHNTQLMW